MKSKALKKYLFELVNFYEEEFIAQYIYNEIKGLDEEGTKMIENYCLNETEVEISDSKTLYIISRILKMRDDKRYVDYCKRATQCDSVYVKSLLSLADIYKEEGNIPEMIKCYEQAINEHGDGLSAFWLYYHYSDNGDNERAFKYLKIGASLGNTDCAYHLLLYNIRKYSKDSLILKKNVIPEAYDIIKNYSLVCYRYKCPDENENVDSDTMRKAEVEMADLLEIDFTNMHRFTELMANFYNGLKSKEDVINKLQKENELLKEKLSKKKAIIKDLKYRPGGPGYLEAKEHFESLN